MATTSSLGAFLGLLKDVLADVAEEQRLRLQRLSLNPAAGYAEGYRDGYLQASDEAGLLVRKGERDRVLAEDLIRRGLAEGRRS